MKPTALDMLCTLLSAMQGGMMTRNVIVGVVVIVLLIAAYFVWRGNETGPQSIPAGTTEPKK